jgi:hypothetical protein
MMALDLELALSELAHTVPVGDDSFPADGMTATVRRMATHVRRRRAAKHAGTSIVGVAAVAAVAIGGSAIKSHVDAARGPSTALSKRAGAVCGQPFDATGKSDLRFTVWQAAGYLDPAAQPPTWSTTLRITELSDPRAKMPPAGPATAVILKDGIVVGIAQALTDFERDHPGTPEPLGNFDDGQQNLSTLLDDAVNCPGTAPWRITNEVLDVVMLSEVAVVGESRTALVAASPVPWPLARDTRPTVGSPSPTPTPTVNSDNWISIAGIGETSKVRAENIMFKVDDYLAVKDTPGANVPLYVWNEVTDEILPYTGPAEAHITEKGSMVATVQGIVVETWTKMQVAGP